MASLLFIGLLLQLTARQSPNVNAEIGEVDLFGQTGLNEPQIRAALPVHAGDKISANKRSFFRFSLTKSRDPHVLSVIRKEALESLIELAHWTDPSHSQLPQVILGRVAGLKESEIFELVAKGDVGLIMAKLPSSPR